MNFDTSDIYIKVDSEIVANGYWDADLKARKVLIEKGLTNYTLSIMNDLGVGNLVSTREPNLTHMLVSLDKIIPMEFKDFFFYNYVEYIRRAATFIQNFEVCWYVEEGNLKTTIDTKFNDDGVWDHITTYQRMCCLSTVLTVIAAFKNNFGVNKKVISSGSAKKYNNK